MREQPGLAGVRVDLLFLDTTYAAPKHTQPPQQEAVDMMVQVGTAPRACSWRTGTLARRTYLAVNYKKHLSSTLSTSSRGYVGRVRCREDSLRPWATSNGQADHGAPPQG